MITTLRPYLKLYRHYFWRILLGLLLAILTLAGSLFLLALSGWFLAATAAVGVAGLYTFNYMLPAAGVRGAAIFRTAARYFERLVNHDTTFQILAYLRIEAFKRLLPVKPEALQYYQKADLLNRFIADIDNLDHLYLRLFSPIITALCLIALIFCCLAVIQLQLASLIALILLFTTLIVPIIFYQLGQALGEQIAKQKSDYRTQSIGYLQGQAELALFAAQQSYRAQLNTTEQRWLSKQKQQATLSSLAQALVLLIVGLMTALVIYLAADGIAGYSAPFIALFVFVCLSSAELLAPIPAAFLFLGQVLASAKRVTQLAELPKTYFPAKGTSLDKRAISLQFSAVNFTYPNQPLPVLHQANLILPAGQHIGLIGQTGCGKSTLLKLITREWQPDSGQILLNQTPLDQLDETTLRQCMAVVPQTITIFSDTLRRNLLIGNHQASDEALRTVLRQVELDKLLDTEQQLDLWLGEGGRPLSGGERRRIGIARALLHEANLVIMDEPTESLDAQTEQQLIGLIKQHCHGKTLLIVTHRLTESQIFDRVYRLHAGQLIANEV